MTIVVTFCCCYSVILHQVGLGEHNIVPNYFEQNQAEALDPQLTVLETLIRAAPDAKLNDLKQLLGRMLFSGTAMDKKVRVCCWQCMGILKQGVSKQGMCGPLEGRV